MTTAFTSGISRCVKRVICVDVYSAVGSLNVCVCVTLVVPWIVALPMQAGSAYSVLFRPARDDAMIDGWFTEQDGGTQGQRPHHGDRGFHHLVR